MNVYVKALWVVCFANLVAFALIDRIALIAWVIKFLVNRTYDPFSAGQGPTIAAPPTLLPEYDFIVVGAGIGGCVLANRLSANPKWNVLLLEAGPEETTIMDVPLFVHFLQTDRINWKYRTEAAPGQYCGAMEDGRCNWPRGKVMGGSSVLNFMIYTRGNRWDYDNWAALGNAGWSYDEVRPYFELVEQVAGVSDGAVPITKATRPSVLSSVYVAAAQQLGLAPNADYDGAHQPGVSYLKTTINNGMRVSSNRAYIDPIRGVRPNLHVQTGTLVNRVLIDATDRRARGVEVTHAGQRSEIRATKEVLIAGGGINSPQLLMLSGIGPAEHLRSVNVEPLVDLPGVGRNLMDHVSPGYLHFTINVTDSPRERMLTPAPWWQFFNDRSGPIASAGGCEALAFYDSENFTSTDAVPDVELLQVSGALYDSPELHENMGLRKKHYMQMFWSAVSLNQLAMSFGLFVLRPKSRGWMQLRDNQATTHPLIVPNYFADADDMRLTIDAIRRVMSLEQTEAFRRINATALRATVDQCWPLEWGTDEYWECYVRHVTVTVYHYSGTCKMGPHDDPMAVVDERLRVRGGVRGLRVVDASVFPVIVSGHPQAAVYMVAEKAAAMIAEDWR